MSPKSLTRQLVVAGLLSSSSAFVCAQVSVPAEPAQIGRPVPRAAPDLQLLSGESQLTIPVVPPGAMAPDDRELATAAQQRIQRGAALLGFNMAQAGWTFMQLQCAAFPNYVLLRYAQEPSPHSRSEFSVAIPRQAGAPVRVMPVLRAGNSLFSPAAQNTATVHALNRLAAGQQSTPSLGSYVTCYAALAGAKAQSGPGDSVSIRFADPLFTVESSGQITASITSESNQGWRLEFNKKGELLRALQAEPALSAPRPVPQKTDPPSRPVPESK